MKSHLLISCFVSVVVHSMALSFPLDWVDSPPPAHIKTPISLSIMSTEIPAAAMPVSKAPAETLTEPLLPPKKKTSAKKTLSPEMDGNRKEMPVAAPAADPGFTDGEKAKDNTVPLTDGIGVGTAPDREDTPTDSQQGVAAPGGQKGQDVIVYARPRYKENPLPHYPRLAKRRGYEGQVLLRVEVLESGQVGRVEIAASSGFDILDEAALQSVKAWTFVPGTKNGEKVDQLVMVPVRFSLR